MKNKLTAAQVQLLRANIYVENATENYVGLTEKANAHQKAAKTRENERKQYHSSP